MIQQIKHGVWYFYVKDNNVIDFREFSAIASFQRHAIQNRSK